MKHTTSLLVSSLLVGAAAVVQAAELRIEQVAVVSPERSQPLRNATVVVKDGRIVSVVAGPSKAGAADATVVSGQGLYLTPGLIDSHVHTNEIPGVTSKQEAEHPDVARAARAQFPRSYLFYGYTTLIDLIGSPERMNAWNAASEVRPDTFFCGAVPVIGGYGVASWKSLEEAFKNNPYTLVQPGEEAKLPASVDPKQHTVEAVVSRMKADGARCVKVFAEDGFGPSKDVPMIKLDDAKKLVRVAHAAGLPVFMHANAADMQAFALEAGADVIAHGMWHWDVPPAAPPAPGTVRPAVQKILDGVVAKRVGWQPTMQVLYGERDLADPDYLSNPDLLRVYPASLIAWYRTPEAGWFRDMVMGGLPGTNKDMKPAERWPVVQTFYARYLGQNENATAYVFKRHGKLMFGTDTPSSPSYANPPGLNGYIEMHRWVAAGLTPMQVFRAATLTNAQTLKMDAEIGTVEVGKRANLLLTREDPTKTVDAYGGIVKLIVGGRVIEPAELAANR